MADFNKSTVYQIYPKSFYDSNNDGYGDLRGVIEKLDYIEKLGVDYIWMTPFFISPQKDNGYDVADYYNIDPRYGTMEDFEDLVKEAENRNIKLMLDMVFNHVSSEHIWFKKALAGDKKYKDYFIFKKGKKPGVPPTNWTSKFGGSAWEYVEEFDEYYLHIFDVSQPDLNWDNEEVRQEVQKVVRFWAEKGVKGFRFDVINLISKGKFEDDFIGDGRRFYTDGPRVHEYIKELNSNSFGQNVDIITVGEMNSTSMEHCFKYAGKDTNELSMVFNFHHMKVDYVGNEKWVLVPFDFAKLKNIIFDWQVNMQDHDAWNAVFWCNHDQPRVVSRFGNTDEYWRESAKMLGTVVHCLRGTPYVYQGEEIGMTNAGYTDINQYRDVESLNHFQILQDKGISKENAHAILQVHSRDNARTPMQWSGENHAGFTEGTPWIEENKNYEKINAKDQLQDSESIFNHYKKLISLRKDYDIIAYGDFEPIAKDHKSVFAYKRTYKNETLIVVNNFYGKETQIEFDFDTEGFECLISNYDKVKIEKVMTLRPYESIVYYSNK